MFRVCVLVACLGAAVQAGVIGGGYGGYGQGHAVDYYVSDVLGVSLD